MKQPKKACWPSPDTDRRVALKEVFVMDCG